MLETIFLLWWLFLEKNLSFIILFCQKKKNQTLESKNLSHLLPFFLLHFILNLISFFVHLFSSVEYLFYLHILLFLSTFILHLEHSSCNWMFEMRAKKTTLTKEWRFAFEINLRWKEEKSRWRGVLNMGVGVGQNIVSNMCGYHCHFQWYGTSWRKVCR